MTRRPQFNISERLPHLRELGVAVEYFPHYANSRHQPHTVDVVLLTVILRGQGRHLLQGAEFEEAGNSVTVLHYGEEHSITTGPGGMEIYNVYLDLRGHPLPALPVELRPVLAELLPLHPGLRHHLNARARIPVDDIAPLAAALHRICAEMAQPRAGWREAIRHSFQLFLIDLCRAALSNGIAPLSAGEAAAPRWLEETRRYLDAEFATPEPPPLAELAARAGVSVTYLCRRFRAYTGKSVTAYRIERQIQAAMWKLREGDEKVISIALSCGFNDLAYFNRAFRALAGVTPTQYRANATGQIP